LLRSWKGFSPFFRDATSLSYDGGGCLQAAKPTAKGSHLGNSPGSVHQRATTIPTLWPKLTMTGTMHRTNTIQATTKIGIMCVIS
jgi:hypothetical protein